VAHDTFLPAGLLVCYCIILAAILEFVCCIFVLG